MRPKARKAVCLTDASKFGAAGRARAADWSKVAMIVTDQPPPAAVAAAARDGGVEVRIA